MCPNWLVSLSQYNKRMILRMQGAVRQKRDVRGWGDGQSEMKQ